MRFDEPYQLPHVLMGFADRHNVHGAEMDKHLNAFVLRHDWPVRPFTRLGERIGIGSNDQNIAV